MVSRTRRALFAALVKKLECAGIPEGKQEAAFVLEQLSGMQLPRFLMDGEQKADEALAEQALSLCEKRCTGYPLQYLLGEWDFFGLTLSVGEGVLIPRADTETLVEEALRLRAGAPSTKMADLCSGSGCIPAAIARNLPGAVGFALEKSPEAMQYLRQNLEKHAPEICPVLCDVLLPETADAYTELDLITSNPPYLTAEDMRVLQREVTFEPEMALLGGEDGLDFYRTITRVWKSSLKKGGWLLFETGMGQHEAVEEILRENGFCQVQTLCDLAGIGRVVRGKRDF
ncbi:MAG: peptide chain release factor N(5)-glutamine methyltransferase [Ruminococcus sp.]|nr:peptide chain release factor N(5)-glutamine methyltransferase [Ruminococcus sp.]